ncbi:MAG TPA: tetratricopeptide repeat protein [Terriglobales bacterium]
MKRSRKLTAVASVLLISCIAGSVVLLRAIDRVRSGATLEQFLYISSPQMVKRLSLGYDGIVADIYWTRAVQYFGGTFHKGGGRYELLWPLLNITTQLDPHIIPAYQYGATFLTAKPPNGAGLPDKAIELVQFGIRNNPDNWRLYEDLGFIYYSDLKDYPKAAEAFLRGSKVPNAHPFLRVLAAQAAEHGGEPETAMLLWTAIYETTPDKDIRVTAAWHLRALKVDKTVTQLNQLVESYKQRLGRLPGSFVDLVRAGLLPGIPLDPYGNPYRLQSDGRAVVADPENFPFVEKGLPDGYVPTDTIPRNAEH